MALRLYSLTSGAVDGVVYWTGGLVDAAIGSDGDDRAGSTMIFPPHLRQVATALVVGILSLGRL